jgi:hypothetical protein
MRVADRVTDVADRVQTRRLETKRDTLDRDNERLRTELRITREELDRERGARDDLMGALKKGEGTVKADKVKVKTKKRGGFLRLLIVGGGAYVLGTRAGRERYEQIKTWASDMKDRVGSGQGEDEWSSMSNGGSSGASGSMGSSGMSGSTGSSTGSGSTSSGTSAGTTGSSTSGSTGSGSTGSGSTGSTGSGSTGTGSSGSTGSTGSGSTGSGSTGSTSTGSTGSTSTGSTGGSTDTGSSGSTSSKRTGSSGSTSSS